MWQQLIVFLIVGGAALHFCTKYLPLAWRQQIVHFLARRGFDQAKMAKLFKTGPSCGSGCGSCGSCDTPAKPAASDSASASSSSSSSNSSKRVIMLRVQR
ncbi:DUF6587 family protein [Rugamonas sp. DEMB1]|jgi:hypothetical protein|uniref:DUF6587 family protein n=1 Tax=Rugamonas sp. DEMB1 TaxID=3039386 RepID=UPI0024487784|nr:hypothetical protein [Rugamonas sp. DEMB1]WGG50848.1 hypothetical protein QC826_00575 [Rugamonas sp. DEMB1]